MRLESKKNLGKSRGFGSEDRGEEIGWGTTRGLRGEDQI
jgi:hypothetical protein